MSKSSTKSSDVRYLRHSSSKKRVLAAVVAMLMAPGMSSAHSDEWVGNPVVCEHELCLIATQSLADTDKDGFSDADEEAAGTDPLDATSHPSVLELVELTPEGLLPSFAKGLTEVVVLPTLLPDGSDLGHRFDWPARDNALSRLGITSELLDSVGLDSGLGIRIQADLSATIGTKLGDRPHIRVAGLDVGLISAGDDDLAPLPNLTGSKTLYGESPFAGQPTSRGDTVQTDEYGNTTFARYYSDGSMDYQTRNADGSTSQTSLTPDLDTAAQAEESAPKTTSNADGSTTTESHSSSSTDHSKTYTDTSTTQYPDGRTHTETTSTTVSYDSAGYLMSTTTKTVTDTAADGSTKTTTTTQRCSEAGCSAPETKTTESEKDDEYINPDADFDVIYVTEEDVKRVVGLATGSNTTPGPVVTEGPTEVDPYVTVGGFNPLIALVDDQLGSEGGVVVLNLHATPEADPRLPSIDDMVTGGWCGNSCN